jgi:hypothetical protein
MSEPNVTVIRPDLTPEEREERMEEVKRCLIAFWIACKQKEGERRD